MDYREVLQARKIIEDKLAAMGIEDDGDDEISFDITESTEIYDSRSEENRNPALADLVKLVIPSVYSAELLDMEENEFQEFLRKAEDAEIATVFDVDEDDPRWVSIVWEDGLEIINVHRKTLKVVCYDEDEEDE